MAFTKSLLRLLLRGALVAATCHIFQIRHQNKLRQTDLVMKMYSAFASEDHQKARKKILWITYEDYDFVKECGGAI